jgi:hypothetical protein
LKGGSGERAEAYLKVLNWPPNGRRGKDPERDTALREGKALEGEPQEGYRHEIRPEGFGRSKPLRG